MDRIQELVHTLNLHPHPEGGFYAETWRADRMVETPNGSRAAGTAIYFLLTQGNFSAFHRIASDEVWHFYEGDPVHIHIIEAQTGHLQTVKLGPFSLGGTCQAVVKAGDWFASESMGRQGYALVGCTVAPGFDFHDFELANRDPLCRAFPRHQAIIERLTRA